MLWWCGQYALVDYSCRRRRYSRSYRLSRAYVFMTRRKAASGLICANGVTTVVDAGSAGTANFDALPNGDFAPVSSNQSVSDGSRRAKHGHKKIMILTILMTVTRCFASIAMLTRLKLKGSD
ncbi:hypothetical protein KCP77_23640 [Salmonella enterica subsp. enterica]|nr:hypothetical protein KCP77_23640 [Salmonella enterica subsp. enterica]